jgi:hypothetical protein
MLATVGSIQRRPICTGGQLMDTKWHYENWTMYYHLRKRTLQIAETGGLIGKQVHNPVYEQ